MFSNPAQQQNNQLPVFPKFSSMMEEWSDEEQLAFEDALKKYIYLSHLSTSSSSPRALHSFGSSHPTFMYITDPLIQVSN